MIITRDYNHGDYEIRSYKSGEIKINDEIYHNSVVVSTHQLIPWPPQNLSELSDADFEVILSLKPEVVLLGTGNELFFPKRELLKTFYSHQIGIEIMNTHAACRTFNVLMSESRNVVAALLIR